MNFVFTALFTFIMLFNWRENTTDHSKEPKTIQEMSIWINSEHDQLRLLVNSGDRAKAKELIETIHWHLTRLKAHVKPQVSIEYGAHINSLIQKVDDQLTAIQDHLDKGQFIEAKDSYTEFSSAWHQLNHYGLRYASKWEELRLALSEQDDVEWTFNDTILRFFDYWRTKEEPPPPMEPFPQSPNP